MHAQVNVDTRRRSGSRYVEAEVRDDHGEFIAFVSFEQIDARWGDLYTALIWFNDRDSQRFPFDPKQIDDRLMKRLGIRKWMVFEPAMKLAFGKTRSNPSRGRRNPLRGRGRSSRNPAVDSTGDLIAVDDLRDGTAAVVLRRYSPKSRQFWGLYDWIPVRGRGFEIAFAYNTAEGAVRVDRDDLPRINETHAQRMERLVAEALS